MTLHAVTYHEKANKNMVNIIDINYKLRGIEAKL